MRYATVIGGEDFFLLRFNPDGSPDTTFSGDGKTTTPIAASGGLDEAFGVALQSDGKIILAGQSATGFGYINFSVVSATTD